ncbi:peptide/nickel transport system ATP-binding protein [Petrotoga sibirica]|uniref:Peptide/nickel transport system ATP-binding protein n=1 Tax=Petrotoga sibirica TaxID=156202 RepID=A0A4R8ELZ7_9BACT|nr:ABC transporter ATP-binding protein [Petrotoga sibirica]TDX13180.1 peptide/nickel transport system ATP-binding protein [Petrotoga sibirica]
MIKTNNILQVEHLKIYFKTFEGISKAVDDISFVLKEKETLGLVGESGCGKTVTNLAIMKLLNAKSTILSGKILYNGWNILQAEEVNIRKLRGKEIGMIFQEPMASFDPLFTIGEQMSEVCKTHLKLSKQESRIQGIEMMKRVGIPEPEKRYDEYPHEMSGGMLQRAMIALNLLTNPKILIADEPTTALDVTVQAQVLNLMKSIQKEFGNSIIFITHDLGVISEMADRVHVMYAGKIVEKGSTMEIFENPKHPYTIGLMKSKIKKEYKAKSLPYIRGTVPNPQQFPVGCRFHPRCEYAMEICRESEPQETVVNEGHLVSCWLFGNRGDELENNKS